MQGRKHSQETKAKKCEPYPLSTPGVEAKSKIGAAQRGEKKVSEETKAKMRAARLGKISLSQDTKAKLRERIFHSGDQSKNE